MSTWVVVLIVVAVIALIVWGIVSMVHVLQEYERGSCSGSAGSGQAQGARPDHPAAVRDRPDAHGHHPDGGHERPAPGRASPRTTSPCGSTRSSTPGWRSRFAAVVKVQNYLSRVSQSAQTNLAGHASEVRPGHAAEQRESINRELHGIIAGLTRRWGVQVLGRGQGRRPARRPAPGHGPRGRGRPGGQGAADLGRRRAAGLAACCPTRPPSSARTPEAMQIRFLQTVTAVATEQNSTLVMPIPIELLSLFGGGPRRPRQRPPSRPRPRRCRRRRPRAPQGPEEGRPPDHGNGRPA